jgi:hypothetical protein
MACVRRRSLLAGTARGDGVRLRVAASMPPPGNT